LGCSNSSLFSGAETVLQAGHENMSMKVKVKKEKFLKTIKVMRTNQIF